MPKDSSCDRIRDTGKASSPLKRKINRFLKYLTIPDTSKKSDLLDKEIPDLLIMYNKSMKEIDDFMKSRVFSIMSRTLLMKILLAEIVL